MMIYQYEKAKGTKQCVIKRKRKLEDYENCLEAGQLEKQKTKKTQKN